ncbi:MAG: coenzyme F420-0:L-glutamate ligase [Acidimicrobiia bacterium]|nr:coenzyme F420-0:L-glutamate ligase [Acidimicrobiia bacterium]MYC58391.1 coenzyme F420-0:L-glutamate ligase [Acidimicrobiia bacterium]MYG94150.1 coenzyme F420-0:L-glutamate ligase [Acidimicrobiia bacterium]MYI30503.1 coenzyme F420-0:L-glutamate ligase [Acidimicrobiia bacterium]
MQCLRPQPLHIPQTPDTTVPIKLEILAVEGLPEVQQDDDIAALIIQQATLLDGDVVVITQKIVSKAEGAIAMVNPDDPLSHQPIVEQNSTRILRRRGDLIISETKHGFVCANAGVDRSNLKPDQAAFLPDNPDHSAKRIRHNIKTQTNLDVGVIISDTFGRPWRRGVTDMAIGSAGIQPILDLRGTSDASGHQLQVTEIAIVDELAAAAELVMGKAENIPVAIIRGVPADWLGTGTIQSDLIRHPAADLFR